MIKLKKNSRNKKLIKAIKRMGIEYKKKRKKMKESEIKKINKKLS
jgi:hypothetical protein